MTEPTPQQYEAILKYMEATNEESFDKAREALQKCDYNISVAVNSKFGGERQGPQYQEHQEAHQDDEEIVMQYMRHLRKKQHDFSIIWGVVDFFKGIVVGLFKGISELIFPQFLKKKMIRSKFYNMYCDLLSVNITDETLTNLLNRSYQTQKPIIFAICSQIGRHNPLVQILNEPRNIRKINESFIFTGAFEQDPECRRIEGEKIPPTIAICRKNVFDKIEILEKYVGDQGISIINVEQLNRVLQKSQNMRKKDRNIQIKYRNYIRRLQYGGYAGFYEEEEEQLYPERTRENTNMIRQQNEDYKRIQEENRRKIQQKEKEQKKQQELVQERQVRKMSIPDEPTEGEIVRLNFRCPDGSIRIRNFLADENLELVYNWVETNEQIEFEDNTNRQFQLMYSFPPTALSDKKSIPLKEVFDSDQEKVMIREL